MLEDLVKQTPAGWEFMPYLSGLGHEVWFHHRLDWRVRISQSGLGIQASRDEEANLTVSEVAWCIKIMQALEELGHSAVVGAFNDRT